MSYYVVICYNMLSLYCSIKPGGFWPPGSNPRAAPPGNDAPWLEREHGLSPAMTVGWNLPPKHRVGRFPRTINESQMPEITGFLFILHF